MLTTSRSTRRSRSRPPADELARSLLPRIPSLQVSVTGPPAGAVVHVEIDGNALPDDAATLPAKVNPGKHAVVASVKAAGGVTDALSTCFDTISGPPVSTFTSCWNSPIPAADKSFKCCCR